MTRLPGVAMLIVTAVLAAGCATAQARVDPAAGPSLAPPLPPPRAVEPVDLPPELPEAAADTGPTPVVVKPSPRPPAPRPDRSAGRADNGKPDSAGAAQPPAPTAASQPLQTTANVAEAERNVRVLMGRAVRDLDRIDARALSGDRRLQYDTARRFLQQAADALRVKNYVFAEQLADKAATLAAALTKS